MRNIVCLIAAAVLAATPATAQENVAAPVANDTATSDANVITDMNVVMAPPDTNATEPAATPTTSELATGAAADADDQRRGFPWGLLGLVGLIGLLGRRRGS